MQKNKQHQVIKVIQFQQNNEIEKETEKVNLENKTLKL